MGDQIAVALAKSGKTSSFWTVLPQQPIEVLVAATLPWVMRISEVTTHTGDLFDLPVAMELGAVVPRNRFEEPPALADELQHCTVDCRDGAVCKLGKADSIGRCNTLMAA